MTTGIYALYWEEQDLIYVGQSVNIEERGKSHLSKLRSKDHINYRVQDTYNLYGDPELIILEECEIQDLNYREVYWTEEFNSIEKGLNIIEAGVSGGSGLRASRSKYSRLQILLVFRYISSTNYLTAEEVHKLTGVHSDTVVLIAAQKLHVWLKQEYPFRYALMVQRSKDRNNANNIKGKTLAYINSLAGLGLPVLISPDGIEYQIPNITGFAREHRLDQGHLSKVVNKQRKTHKGWKLKSLI